MTAQAYGCRMQFNEKPVWRSGVWMVMAWRGEEGPAMLVVLRSWKEAQGWRLRVGMGCHANQVISLTGGNW